MSHYDNYMTKGHCVKQTSRLWCFSWADKGWYSSGRLG